MDERSVEQDNFDYKKHLTDIYTRIGNLETHLINLIHPIQQLNRCVGVENKLENLIKVCSVPIQINDSALLKAYESMEASLKMYAEKMNLQALINSFLAIADIQREIRSIRSSLDSVQHDVNNLLTSGIEVHFSAAQKTPEILTSSGKKDKRFSKNKRK